MEQNARACGTWLAAALALAVLTLFFWTPEARAAEPIQGSSTACVDFRLELLGFLDFDITDEGWVWARRSDPSRPQYQSASGVVTSTNVARNDTPANHNSHDEVAHIKVDPGREGILSNVNEPNTEGLDNLEADDGDDDLTTPTGIEMEWETGTFPSERGASVPQRYLPRWAWPNVGDRIWTNGHWVFDCGHAKKVGVFRPNPVPPPPILFIGDDFWRTEIHPARAIASMRSQADVLPGTGTTPVPVTATDLYIHGRAGYITDILNCGMTIIIEGVDEDGDGDGDGDPDACPRRTTPIAENFEFVVCLPPRPSANAEVSWRVGPGPANTVGDHEVAIDVVDAPGACENDGDEDSVLYDLATALHVLVPLANSGVGDLEVYARKIVAGWIHPPNPPLTHLHMTLDNVNLHESGDGGIIASDDGELTFFFASINRAPDEWVRLADYAPVASNGNSRMNDYDPSLFGDSFMPLGAPFDFYVRNGGTVNVAANVYDQDCYDDHFGDHILSTSMYVNCALDIHETGNNDALDKLGVTLDPPAYGSDPSLNLGTCPGVPGATGGATCNVTTTWKPKVRCCPVEIIFRPDYELNFTLEKLALTDEDTADLRVTKTCVHEGEVLLVGQPATCTILVESPGPGLPRGVTVDDDVAGLSPSDLVIGTPVVTGNVPAGTTCATSASGFVCTLETLRVGGSATITVTITPLAPGTLTNTVSVSTDSTDPQSANDTSEVEEIVFVPVEVEIKPVGTGPAPVNLKSKGVVPVAVLTTSIFDATTIDVASVCFGDAETPAERDCSEAHAKLHLEDVDRDGDIDAVLHYETQQTGIDLGDTRACLRGVTRSGIHFFGCDAITTR